MFMFYLDFQNKHKLCCQSTKFNVIFVNLLGEFWKSLIIIIYAANQELYGIRYGYNTYSRSLPW